MYENIHATFGNLSEKGKGETNGRISVKVLNCYLQMEGLDVISILLLRVRSFLYTKFNHHVEIKLADSVVRPSVFSLSPLNF